MSKDKVDPNAAHAFVEKANLPVIAMELAVRRTDAATECAICGRPRSDRIHEEAELAAEAEDRHWPA